MFEFLLSAHEQRWIGALYLLLFEGSNEQLLEKAAIRETNARRSLRLNNWCYSFSLSRLKRLCKHEYNWIWRRRNRNLSSKLKIQYAFAHVKYPNQVKPSLVSYSLVVGYINHFCQPVLVEFIFIRELAARLPNAQLSFCRPLDRLCES